jgi:hypothetical protein
MKQVLKGSLACGVIAIVLLLGYRELQRNLYNGMSTDKTADINTWNTVNFIIGAVLVLLVVLVVWTIKQAKREDLVPGARQDVIVDADYRTLPNYQAPQAQLPGPRYITVPRFTTNGTAQPLGATSPATTILQTQIDSELLTVPIDKLMRFLSLDTPKRTEWVSKPAIYGDCLRFADAHGLLDHKPGGGFTWKREYPIESRKQWILQFDQQDAGAREE